MSEPRPHLYNRRRQILFLCILGWLCAFLLTHIPADRLPKVHATDKTLHMSGYTGLAFLLLLTMAAYKARSVMMIIVPVVSLAIYGAFDELTQPLVNRHASLHDWYADMYGVLAAVFIWNVVAWLVRKWRTAASRRTS